MRWSVILSQVVASKAVVDKIHLPRKYYNKVDQGLSELESWTGLFKGLEVDKPQTWFQTGLKVMRRISAPEKEVEAPKKSLIFRFADKMNYVRLENLNTIKFYEDLIRRYYSKSEVFIEGEKGDLRRIKLPDCPEDFYFYEVPNRDDSDFGIEAIPFVPDFDDHRDRRVALNKALASLYWSDRQIIKLDMRNDIIEYIELDPLEREYEGVLTDLFKSLQIYKDKGIRRCVLFQGPPGTGKSTLAFNIAERLSNRTIILTHHFLNWVNDYQWKYILSVLEPDMILVDDIDRISDRMERRLSLFEDHYCNVPLIIMTSNHYSKLPSAFKRPGRIDQIIEMQNPSKSIRYEVIRAIARQENVKVPNERMDILDEIHENYAGAYIVEILRRVKAEGWNYKIQPYDLTFKDLSKETRRKWNQDEVPPSMEEAVEIEADDSELDPMNIDIDDLGNSKNGLRGRNTKYMKKSEISLPDFWEKK